MTPEIEDTKVLRTHVRHLKYAVATTTCRETVAMLRKILNESEARLQTMELRLITCNPKLLYVFSPDI